MSQQKDTPVPKLDLAPKRQHPLSLWNPLDYLQLLYWVFFFPQALRWYEDTFERADRPSQRNTLPEFWRQLRRNPVQLLLVQGLILTIIVSLVCMLLLQAVGGSIDLVGVAVGVAVGGVCVAFLAD